MDEEGGEHQQFLDEFLDICTNHLKNDQQILTLVRQTYKKTNPNFLATCEFRDKVQITGAKIESNPSRIYIYIKELIEELKPYKIKKDKKRKHEQENNSEHVAKKSRTLLLTATVELNAHEKFSNRYRDHSPDEESPESGEGGSVVTTIADIHPLTLAKPDSRLLNNTVQSLASSVINPKKVNHSSPSNCSIQINDDIDNLDSIPEQPGGRLRRRIHLLPVMDNGDDSESTQPPKTSLASTDDGDVSEKDEAWNPVENGYESGASSISVTKKCKKMNRTADMADALLENGCSSTTQDVSVSESDSPVKKIRGRASERQIQRLEKLLYNMDKEIKRLGEKEIGLDDLDDDDSAYLRCERLKARFNKVFNKLCELKDREKLTGRVIEKKFGFEGTRYPEVNKGIRKFVNKKKMFPDYQDVLAIIIRANRRHKLQLKKSAIDSLCREAFTDVGDQLQRRRHKDFISDFGCHLTDNDRTIADPAIFDKNLRRKLEENGRRGKSKMEEVLEKYSKKQFDLHSGKLDDTDDEDSDQVEEVFEEEERLEEKEQEMELEEVLNASDSEDELPVLEQKKPEPVMMIISDDESEPERSPDVQSIYTTCSEVESDDDSVELVGNNQVFGVVSVPRKTVDEVDRQGTRQSEDSVDLLDENSVECSDLRVVGVVHNSVDMLKVENSVNVMETGNKEDTTEKCMVGDSQGSSGLQVVGVVGNVQGLWGSQEMDELVESQKSVSVNDTQNSVGRNVSQNKKLGEFDVPDIVPNMLKVDKADSAKTTRERLLDMGKVEKKGTEKVKDILSSPKRVKSNVADPVRCSKALQRPTNSGKSKVEASRQMALKIRSPGQRKKIKNMIKSLKQGTSGIVDSPVAKIPEPVQNRDNGTCCLKGGEDIPDLLKVADSVAPVIGGVENVRSLNEADVEVCTISDSESESDVDLGWDFKHRSSDDDSLVELSDGDPESDKNMFLVEDAKAVSSHDKNKDIKSSPTSPKEKIPSIDQFDIISTPVKKKPLCFDSAKLKLKCSPGFVKRTRSLIERTNNSYVSLTDSEDEGGSVKSGEGDAKLLECPPASEYIYIE